MSNLIADGCENGSTSQQVVRGQTTGAVTVSRRRKLARCEVPQQLDRRNGSWEGSFSQIVGTRHVPGQKDADGRSS
jgi:hypothetical protein